MQGATHDRRNPQADLPLSPGFRLENSAAGSRSPATSHHGTLPAMDAAAHGQTPSSAGGALGAGVSRRGMTAANSWSRRSYPSDLTHSQWYRIAPLLERGRGSGRPLQLPPREVVNAINYRWTTGCSWRMLPHDLPRWEAVYAHFRRWQRNGTLKRLREELTRPVRMRRGQS